MKSTISIFEKQTAVVVCCLKFILTQKNIQEDISKKK